MSLLRMGVEVKGIDKNGSIGGEGGNGNEGKGNRHFFRGGG